MKTRSLFLAAFGIMLSCSAPSGSDNQKPEQLQGRLPITGTWQLISATRTQADSTFSTFDARHKFIKIINDTHFAFMNHDLNKGQDSAAVFVSGGGSYVLEGNKYSEHLEYCNYREWEDNHFEFTLELKNDTLIQQGREWVEALGVDRVIVETYVRLK